ncbi:hypothetical protein F0U61_14760 [Archangium violaceum]|uniref:hypothetical protein n=1 Tax=Archangium violaceum TaxID=83451 RepID=UPI002B2DBC34|nr:hypothetical protein F0U61_14760 [Archangium violaceum]
MSTIAFRARPLLSALLLLTLLSGCPGPGEEPVLPPEGAPDGGGGSGPENSLSGRLVYENAGGVYEFDLGARRHTRIFAGGHPDRLASGETLVVDDDFQKLYLAAAGGTQQRTYLVGTTELYSLFEPRASPDGKLVAFTFGGNSLQKGTFVYTRDGTRRAAFPGLFSPTWLPDGRLLMSGSWSSPRSIATTVITPNAAGLYLSDATLTTTRRIDPRLNDPVALQPSVSPDGKQVAFVLSGHLWVMGLDGSALRQVTTGTKQESYPVWSPDGAWIAVVAYGAFETASYKSVAIVPASGTMLELTTHSSYWLRDPEAGSDSSLSRISSAGQMSWR